MADYIKPVSFQGAPVDDQLAIQRQQRLAQMLQQQASEPLQGNQMVSGRVVPIGLAQGLAKLAQGYFAGTAADKADSMARDAVQRQRSSRQATLGQLNGVDEDTAIQIALSSEDPAIQQMGMEMYKKKLMPENVVVGRSLLNKRDGKVVGQDATWQQEQEAARAAKSEELEQKRQARIEELRIRAEDAKALQSERLAAQRELRTLAAGMSGGQNKAPAGYRFKPDGSLEAIPGGPADQKKQGQLNADTASMQAASSAMDRLAEFANGLKEHPGLKGITGLRGAIPNIPGSDAANAQARLETLKSQVAFGVLQAMRDASKTGGALGAVSEKELSLLQNNLAALDKAQSYEEFQSQLQNIIAYTAEAKSRIRNAYNMKHGEQTEAAPVSGGVKAITSDAEYNALPSGTTFVGPDGKQRRKP